MRVKYDLHIHTALSPCADSDMTPLNITGMARVEGLDIIAISDHNSARNVRACIEANKQRERETGKKLLIVPAMELSAKEDVHVLCLFYTLKDCERFNELVKESYLPCEYLPERQSIFDADDNIIGNEPQNLWLPTKIRYGQIEELMRAYYGVAVPAHIDRGYSGVCPTIGWQKWETGTVEVKYELSKVVAEYPEIKNYRVIRNSDSHSLDNIGDACGEIDLVEKSVKCLLDTLREFPKNN